MMQEVLHLMNAQHLRSEQIGVYSASCKKCMIIAAQISDYMLVDATTLQRLGYKF